MSNLSVTSDSLPKRRGKGSAARSVVSMPAKFNRKDNISKHTLAKMSVSGGQSENHSQRAETPTSISPHSVTSHPVTAAEKSVVSMFSINWGILGLNEEGEDGEMRNGEILGSETFPPLDIVSTGNHKQSAPKSLSFDIGVLKSETKPSPRDVQTKPLPKDTRKTHGKTTLTEHSASTIPTRNMSKSFDSALGTTFRSVIGATNTFETRDPAQLIRGSVTEREEDSESCQNGEAPGAVYSSEVGQNGEAPGTVLTDFSKREPASAECRQFRAVRMYSPPLKTIQESPNVFDEVVKFISVLSGGKRGV